MHRQYGPVVRVRPDVVHVNDPAFIDQLYTLSPNIRRERASSILRYFLHHFSVLPTRDHDLHRSRRAVLSKFFSQQNVRRLIPTLNDTLADLLARLEDYSKLDGPVTMNPVFRAATKDVIQSYALGEGRKCLRMDDLNAPFFDLLAPKKMTHVGGHFPWVPRVFEKLPPSIVTALDSNIVVFMGFLEVRRWLPRCLL